MHRFDKTNDRIILAAIEALLRGDPETADGWWKVLFYRQWGDQSD